MVLTLHFVAFCMQKRWKLIQNLKLKMTFLCLFCIYNVWVRVVWNLLKFGVWLVTSFPQATSVPSKSFLCHNKPKCMWSKGILDQSSYKGEKWWLKIMPDPWTHCTNILGYSDTLRTRESVTVSRYLLTVTLLNNKGFTKTVTVSGVSM